MSVRPSRPLSGAGKSFCRAGLRTGASLFFALLLTGCQEDLYSGLSQREANEIIAVLDQNQISAKRRGFDGTYSVAVSPDEIGIATTVLERMGLPRTRHKTMMDLFPGDTLIVTPYEQEARMGFAISQELSQTLESMEGVSLARVHVVMPTRDIRNRIVTPSSASVVLQYNGGQVRSLINEQVRLVVANAVPALELERIAITNLATDQSEVGAQVNDSNVDPTRSTGAIGRNGAAAVLLGTPSIGSLLIYLALLLGVIGIALHLFKAPGARP